MKRSKILLAAPLALLSAGALSGCVTDGYGYGGVGYGYGEPYAYDGYYDGFYGSVYDGYWGNDGYFYYRGNANERRFRRGDHAHFSRQAGNGGGHWQQMHGNFQRSQGMHTPSFPRGPQGGAPGGGGHGGGRGGHH